MRSQALDCLILLGFVFQANQAYARFEIHSFLSHAALFRLTTTAAQILHMQSKNLSAGFSFAPAQIVSDKFSTTLKYNQNFKDIEIFGNQTLIHFNSNQEVSGVSEKTTRVDISLTPVLSVTDALTLLNDRYGYNVELSEPAQLKIFNAFDGATHLVYLLKTKSTETSAGKEVFLDAHRGSISLEINRTYDFNPHPAKRTIYRADTQLALKLRDSLGAPIFFSLQYYQKVLEDGVKTTETDLAAKQVYSHLGRVYNYYAETFGRKSYDGKDSRITAVVHMGAGVRTFWSSELNFIAYGDGDGKKYKDFTTSFDVTAHELTHALTASTAKLLNAGETGALNESFSDFFAKIMDCNPNCQDWDIGRGVLINQRAQRNMENPIEFGQPDHNDSPLKTSIDGTCHMGNDNCGVHQNSGIPNRVASLIVKGIGKEKAELLYFNTLTQRLTPTATFTEARTAIESACTELFGKDSPECLVVSRSFDTVKIHH